MIIPQVKATGSNLSKNQKLTTKLSYIHEMNTLYLLKMILDRNQWGEDVGETGEKGRGISSIIP